MYMKSQASVYCLVGFVAAQRSAIRLGHLLRKTLFLPICGSGKIAKDRHLLETYLYSMKKKNNNKKHHPTNMTDKQNTLLLYVANFAHILFFFFSVLMRWWI